MNVLLLGPSGLIGNLALGILLKDERVKKLIIISRRKVEYKVASKIANCENRIVNIVGNLAEFTIEDFHQHGIDKIDICLCALGTTIKKAKTKEEFQKVDLDLVVKMAKLSKEMGANHFGVISAQGASHSSPFFYSRVKAMMEAEVMRIKFNSTTIIRPGLLIGERVEHRPMEQAFIKFSPILDKVLIGKMKQFRGIKAEKVALVLVQTGLNSTPGIHIVENLQLLDS